MTKKQLSISIRASDEATKVLRRVGEAMKRITSLSLGAAKGLARFAFSFKGLLAGAAVFKFVDGIRNATSEIDTMAKQARELGLSLETFSTLTVAADRSGVAVGKLNNLLSRGQVALAEFQATGSGESATSFRRLEELGATFRNAEGESSSFGDALPSLITALRGVSDEGERLNIVSDLFGTRNGPKALRFLLDYEKALVDGKETGAIFNEEQGKLAEEITDAFSRVREAVRALQFGIVEALGPDAVSVINGFAKAVAKIPEAVGNLLKVVKDAFGEGGIATRARQQLANFGTAAVQLVADAVLGSAEILFMASANVADGVLRGIGKLIGPIFKNVVLSTVASVMDDLDNIFRDSNPILRSMADMFRTAGQGARELADDISVADFNSAFDSFKIGLSDAPFQADSFKQSLQRLNNELQESGGRFVEIGSELLGLEPIIQKIIEELNDLDNPIQSASESLWDFAQGFADSLRQSNEAIDELTELGARLGDTLTNSFTNNFVTAIQAFQDNTKSAKEIFRDFASSVLRDIQAMAIRAAVLNVFSGLGGALGGQSSATVSPNLGGTAFSSGSVRRFNLGGIVPGPNINRDVIPAVLTPGERVLNRREARSMDEASSSSNVNIYVNVTAPANARPADLGRSIAEQLIQQLRGNVTMRGEFRGMLA